MTNQGIHSWQTNQLCYVARGVKKLILSKETCTKLGMLSISFPAVGCKNDVDVGATSNSLLDAAVLEIFDSGVSIEQFDLTPCAPDENGSCSCPRREPTPEPPDFDPSLSVPELLKKIIKHYAASVFNRCTRKTMPLMKGKPLPIPVRKDAKPVAAHTPVPIPLHWEHKVYRDIQRDVSLGVIEPVPVNTPVTWCHRMVVVPKHNGEPRRTVDMQALNRASVRQTPLTRSPFMLASSVPAGRMKSVIDIWNSFHSVPLTEGHRDKTTFITPWGRYRYRVSTHTWIPG